MTLHDQTASARRRKNALLDQEKELENGLTEARQSFTASGSSLDGPEFRAVERISANLQSVKAELADAKDQENWALAQMRGVGSTLGAGSLLSDRGTLSELEQLAHSSRPIGN